VVKSKKTVIGNTLTKKKEAYLKNKLYEKLIYPQKKNGKITKNKKKINQLS